MILSRCHLCHDPVERKKKFGKYTCKECIQIRRNNIKRVRKNYRKELSLGATLIK